MRDAIRRINPTKATSIGTPALLMFLAITMVTPARADEANARTLFKGMSDYLAGQKQISFNYNSMLEIVTTENQKLGLASSGSFTIERPSKIHATRQGGFADVEFVFDGKTLSLLSKNANAYAQVDAPATIDLLVDELRDKYHRPVPAADLLMGDVYKELIPSVTDAKDLGSGVIGGVECDHLAFRTKEVDWQIWIAQGSRPYPCRYMITSREVAGGPQYSIEVRDWKTGSDVAPEQFTFKLPSGGKKIEATDFPEYDELPAIYALKR